MHGPIQRRQDHVIYGYILICMASISFFGYSSFFKVNECDIKWHHLVSLYEKTQCDSGLYIGNKLKLEHLKLTSYSRMNVRLAAQVNLHCNCL